MLPVVLDASRLPLGLVGRGGLAVRRLRQLIEGGAQNLTVFAEAPVPELAALAGERLVRRLPEAADLRPLAALWIVDLDPVVAERLAETAHAAGTLVNVEDVVPLCDFHSPSVVRRGDLVLAVSTGGRSPGLAARLRRRLERQFGAEWAGHLDDVAARRRAWRAEGRPAAEIGRLTDEFIDRQGWLR